MNKINWKQKLTSRKFWAAVVTFVTTVLVAFGVPDLTIEQVTAIITAGAFDDCLHHRRGTCQMRQELRRERYRQDTGKQAVKSRSRRRERYCHIGKLCDNRACQE